MSRKKVYLEECLTPSELKEFEEAMSAHGGKQISENLAHKIMKVFGYKAPDNSTDSGRNRRVDKSYEASSITLSPDGQLRLQVQMMISFYLMNQQPALVLIAKNYSGFTAITQGLTVGYIEQFYNPQVNEPFAEIIFTDGNRVAYIKQ